MVMDVQQAEGDDKDNAGVAARHKHRFNIVVYSAPGFGCRPCPALFWLPHTP